MSAVTVKEAGTLWCPVSGGGRKLVTPIGANAFPGWSHCVADKCAMWRWGEPLERRFVVCDDPSVIEEPKRPDVIPTSWTFMPHEDDDPAGWVEPVDEMFARRRGYCGMAGEPKWAE